MWSALVNRTGLSIVSTAMEDSDGLNTIARTLPPGVRSLGKLDRTDYGNLVAESKVMLGVGHPMRVSPSVYLAL